MIGASELGALGQTSKAWKAAAIDDDATWSDLIRCRWSNIVSRLPSSIVAAAKEKDHGCREMVKRLTQKVEAEELPGGRNELVKPAGLQASDLILIAELTRHGKPIASNVIDDIQSFAEEGKMSIDLLPTNGTCDDRIVLTRVLPANDDGICDLECYDGSKGYEGGKGWKLKLQLMRKSDGKMCTIFDPGDDIDLWGSFPSTRPYSKEPVDMEAFKRDHLEGDMGFRSCYENLDVKEDGMKFLKKISDNLGEYVDGFYFDARARLLLPKSPMYFGFDQMVIDFENSDDIDGNNRSWETFSPFYWRYWKGARFKEDLRQYFEEAEQNEQEMVATIKRIEISAELSIEDGGPGAGSFSNHLVGSEDSGIEHHGVGFLHLVEQLKGWH